MGERAAHDALAALIDHTLLRADATPDEIERLCGEALEHGFHGVCVNGAHTRRCARLLRDARPLVCTVVGFPLGAAAPRAKASEARVALEEGASELDMVLQIGLLRAGEDELVRADVAGVAEVCREGGALLKVILETCLLSDERKVRGCELARDAGAHFVKTSSGFAGGGGATVEDVALLRRTVGDALGVKAAGGIRTRAEAEALVRAGATRLGASSSVAIVRG